jgi:hypothetical protein
MNTMDNRHASAKAENPDSTGKRACRHALKEGASQRVSIRLVPTLFLAYFIDLGCCAFQRQVDISMDVGKSVKIKQTMGFAKITRTRIDLLATTTPCTIWKSW